MIHCVLSIAVPLVLLGTGSEIRARQQVPDHYARAQELFQKGQLAEAAEVCQAGMQGTEDHRLAYLLGQILFNQAQQLEKKDANKPETREAFEHAKNVLLAAEVLSPSPLDSGLDHAIGYALLRERKFDDAIKRFSWAIEKAPEKVILYKLRGYAHLQVRNYEAARRDLREAVGLEPGNHSNWMSFAEALYLGARTEVARRALWGYYELLELYPPDERHMHTLDKIVEYALAANALEDARKALEMGVELRPEDDSVLLKLGVLLYRLGEFERASGTLDELLAKGDEVGPRNRTEAHLQRGLVAQQLGDHPLAKKHLEESLRISPAHPPSLRALGITLRHLGEHERAREVADRFRSELAQREAVEEE